MPGCRPSSSNSTLTSIARGRSKDMIVRDYFSHDIPGGTNVFDIIQARGYCFKVAGENIGWITADDATAAQGVHSMFMNSPGHRANIMGKTWDRIGIGAYQGDTDKRMFTVLFVESCAAAPAPTPKPTPKPDPEAHPEAHPDADADPDTGRDPSTLDPADADADPDTGRDTAPHPASDAAPHPASDPPPDARAGSDAGADAASDREARRHAHADPDPDPDPGGNPDTDPDTRRHPQRGPAEPR